MRPGPSYSAPPAPSPFDGFVHAIKEVTTERKSRSILVRCGARMPTYLAHETLSGASGWESNVTCPACKLPKETP